MNLFVMLMLSHCDPHTRVRQCGSEYVRSLPKRKPELMLSGKSIDIGPVKQKNLA